MIKTIGILGFGIVGRSALSFVKKREKELYKFLFGDSVQGMLIPFVWDEKMITEQDMKLLAGHGASFVFAGTIKLKTFLSMHDYVLVSPGVNTNEVGLEDKTIACELDLFSVFFKKPTIAITGTLGKTTITKLLAKILASVEYQETSFINIGDQDYGVTIVEGGNVGRGMLDLIDQEEFIDCAVLELSSFQLERSKTFAPDIAVLTNFFHNHLDRHETVENYFEAKWKLFAYQTENQVAIVPVGLVCAHVLRQAQDERRDNRVTSSVVCDGEAPLASAHIELEIGSDDITLGARPEEPAVAQSQNDYQDNQASTPAARGEEPAEATLRSFDEAQDKFRLGVSNHMSVQIQEKLKNLRSRLCIVCFDTFDEVLLARIPRDQFWVLTIQDGYATMLHIQNHVIVQCTQLFELTVLPDVTFLENWLIIIATLYFTGVDFISLKRVLAQSIQLDDHHHRLELFATSNQVTFYNDSKSTVVQATEAAVKKLASLDRPLILILGGIGKGVDRSTLMSFLAGIKTIKKVYCFGKECSVFAGCEQFDHLELVVDAVFATMSPGDLVLFSPSGASFDFFDNYKHRGDVFKDLVLKKAATVSSK